MIDRSQGFREPAPDTVIWRYMDLAKFVSLISSATLFFARADRLGDKYEGSFSQWDVNDPDYPTMITLADGTTSEEMRAAERHARFLYMRCTTYVSCWHMNAGESAAMWAHYASRGAGIAIRSTMQHLTSCIRRPYPYGIQLIRCSEVNYIDYQKDQIPRGNIYYPLLHKRKSFEQEREVRMLFSWTSPYLAEVASQALGLLSPSNLDKERCNTEQGPGVPIPIGVSTLIDAVYIAPSSEGWLKGVVEDLLQKYGVVGLPAHQSSLDEDPFY